MFRSEIVFVEFVFLIWKVLDAFWYAKNIRRENAQEDLWKWMKKSSNSQRVQQRKCARKSMEMDKNRHKSIFIKSSKPQSVGITSVAG